MESITHAPFVSKKWQRRNSPHSVLFRRLFKQPQTQPEARRESRRVRVKAAISKTGWQFVVTDVESRALVFRSDADISNTPYLALNRGIGWCRFNLPYTPISVSLPRREVCEKVERAA